MPQLSLARTTWNFSAIGTDWVIETDVVVSQSLKTSIELYIHEYDSVYSRFNPHSLVTTVSKKAGTYEFPDSAIEIFSLYRQFYEMTDGKMTPLVGALLDHLGYDAHYSLSRKKGVITTPKLSSLKWEGTLLTVDSPTLIDIGAIGKGYLVDQIAAMLSNEHASFTIDASGDIYTKGSVAERIGLEDPQETGKIVGVVTLKNQSLCGSATNRRKWGQDLHHIVDPISGSSTKGIAATWARADTAVLADGIATALFFVDPDKLRQTFNFEYICFYDNRSMRYSEGMKEVV